MPVTVPLQAGLAPDVVFVGGLVYVAFGTQTNGLWLVRLRPSGLIVSQHGLVDGFYNSWPRFGGARLAYKRGAPSYGPSSLQVQTGEAVAWPGQADGNFGLAVNEGLGIVAYQNGAYPIWFGEFTGPAGPSGLNGAPDGLDTIISRSQVTLRKDTRQDVPGMLYPVRAGDLVVGEWIPALGTAVQLDGDVLRVVFAGIESPTPRCATDGTTYALVIGGTTTRLWLGSRADLLALPTAASLTPVPPQPQPPEPIPPEPKPPIPPIPIPPLPPVSGHEEQIMAAVQVQGIIHYVSKKPSGQAGCTNYIQADGTVFSCQPDGSSGSRPAGTDGLWEQGQESGALATFRAGQLYSFLLAPIDKLQA